jgi:hypothetical protein
MSKAKEIYTDTLIDQQCGDSDGEVVELKDELLNDESEHYGDIEMFREHLIEALAMASAEKMQSIRSYWGRGDYWLDSMVDSSGMADDSVLTRASAMAYNDMNLANAFKLLIRAHTEGKFRDAS